MEKLSLLFHWDSENAWLGIPRAIYDRYCLGRPIASPNSRYDWENELLYLDADTDGRDFSEAYAAKLGIKAPPVLGSPRVRAQLGLTDCCDGAVSVVRAFPSVVAA